MGPRGNGKFVSLRTAPGGCDSPAIRGGISRGLFPRYGAVALRCAARVPRDGLQLREGRDGGSQVSEDCPQVGDFR